ncbi:MAG: hypothetical protein ABJ381_22195 [Ilumatobacter sp.]|uniref:hypothetical protein n=1 Tax=Ilumatobacter sp. TaxID=1967498 RepID=UPI0032973BAB
MTSPTHRTVRSLLDSGALDLADPGGGATSSRLAELSGIARRDSVSVARLVEAHTDAVAILHEAGRALEPGAVYGVWASQTATAGVVLDRTGSTIGGSMGFASGLGIVDRALVTTRTGDGTVLVDVDVRHGRGVSVVGDGAGWASPAMGETATGSVEFVDHPVAPSDVLCDPGWYLRRPGFWHGACGPAACWAGAAQGLVDVASRLVDDDPHRRAHHGALVAHDWTLASLLDAAGRQIDAEPDDVGVGERVARSLRFEVSGICRDVMDRFGRAFGPRPYVEDSDAAQRVVDLDLYVKQHHAERELGHISNLGGATR